MRRVPAALLALLIAAPAASQQAARPIPVRTLTVVATTDSAVLRSASQVRALPSGRLIVNDQTWRRLILLDSTFKRVTVLADTIAASNKYGSRPTGIVRFTGDSTLFVDYDAQAFVVIDPEGRFGRTIAPPKIGDLRFVTMTPFGMGGVDPKGRLIYRGMRNYPGGTASNPSVAADGANKPIIGTTRVDSAPIIRADFETRTVDTIATFELPVQKVVLISPRQGMSMGMTAFNPLPRTEEWALLPDGTIAIVRAHDYHIDWINADGKVTSTPKMPFDWRRVTTEEKQALLEVGRVADSTRRAAGSASAELDGTRVSLPFVPVELGDMPDYYPAIRAGQVKADADGRVWILPSTSSLSSGAVTSVSTASELVYDVVNRDGVIVERVKLPLGRSLAGFGPNGAVYLLYARGPGNTRLERAR